MASHYLWTWVVKQLIPTVRSGQAGKAAGMVHLALSNKIHNLCRDLQAGGWYGGFTPAREEGMHGALSSDWRALDRILGFFQKDAIVVDVGSGRGRVLRWLLSHGYERVVGVEIDERIWEESCRHFQRERDQGRLNLIHGPISQVLHPEWRQFFLFNPFDASVLTEFLALLRLMHPEGQVSIVYYNSGALNFTPLESDYEVVNIVLDPCRANIRTVSVLRLKPVSARGPRSGTRAGGSPADAAPIAPGSSDTPSA